MDIKDNFNFIAQNMSLRNDSVIKFSLQFDSNFSEEKSYE